MRIVLALVLVSTGAGGCVHHWRPTPLDQVVERADRGRPVELVVELVDHSQYRGLLVAHDLQSLTLATPQDTIVLSASEIASVEVWRGDPLATVAAVAGSVGAAWFGAAALLVATWPNGF